MKARSRTVALAGVVALALAVSVAACGSLSTVGDLSTGGDPAPSGPGASAPPAGMSAATKSAATGSAATKSAATKSAATKLGTRANPAAIGQVVTISQSGVPQWEVSLSAPSLDATAAVAAGNQFNDAAPAGMVYAEVTVNVKRLADKAATPWVDLTVKFVSAAGTTHTTADHSVSIDGDLMSLNEMYAPATGAGAVVIAIPVDNAAAGMWTVSSMFGDPTFFKAT